MVNNIVLNLMISVVIILIGLMFLEGIWHKKGSIIKSMLDVDDLFFPKIKDPRILKVGDQLSFIICCLMALLTLINGLLFLLSDKIPNVSAIFLFVAVVLSYPTRIVFIFMNRNRDRQDLPRIWPFRKNW